MITQLKASTLASSAAALSARARAPPPAEFAPVKLKVRSGIIPVALSAENWPGSKHEMLLYVLQLPVGTSLQGAALGGGWPCRLMAISAAASPDPGRCAPQYVVARTGGT
jgi:hypothetical protein